MVGSGHWSREKISLLLELNSNSSLKNEFRDRYLPASIARLIS
jgi:hypothetical protein